MTRGPPAEGLPASQFDLERLQFSEEGFWLERRPSMEGHVEERGLVGEAPGGSLKDPRNRDRLNVGRKRAEGRAQVGESVAEVGPEGEVNVVRHVNVNIPETEASEGTASEMVYTSPIL